MSTLRVMTWNVLHFENVRTGAIDYDAYAAVIRESGADVVALNEVYGGCASRGEQARELAQRLGWHWCFSEAFLDDGVDPFGNASRACRSTAPKRSRSRIPQCETARNTTNRAPCCARRSRDTRSS